MKLQTMLQLKASYKAGLFEEMTARILWEEDEQGYILDIADTELTLHSEIYTAATSRNPYQVKVFKSLRGAVAHLKDVGFTQCTVHM